MLISGWFKFVSIFWSFSEITLYAVAASAADALVAEFHTNKTSGTVRFTKASKDDMVKISVKDLISHGPVNLSIHEFPVKYVGPMRKICKQVGNTFDPKDAMVAVDYDTRCNQNTSACALGDLMRRLRANFDPGRSEVNDGSLSIAGPESIFGRSLVVKDSSNNVIACATIKSSSPVKTVVGVFRAISPGIAGTIVLRQSEMNPNSDTSVDIDLSLVDARSESKKGLSLSIHKNASKSDIAGSCSGIDKVFNPLGKSSCDKRKPTTCPIGDLSAKLGAIEVPLPGKGLHRLFFIDTNLPLSGANSVVGCSLVISENGQPLICAKIQMFQEIEAEVTLDGDQGLSGIIGFKQGSMYEPTMVNVSVGESVQIAVHEQQLVPPKSSLSAGCSISSLGSVWHEVSDSGPVDELTLYGPRNVLFRPLVINKRGSSLGVCRFIQPKQPTYHLKAQARFSGSHSDAVRGYINFEQVLFNSSKAFAYSSSIKMNIYYENDQAKQTPKHNWHIHLLPIDGDSSLAIGKRCTSTKGHYNPYDVYVEGNEYSSTCNENSPFRCELGDLSGKLGTYSIGRGMKLFTETENYLASWHNALGRSIVIHAEQKGAPRIACADIHPEVNSSYSKEMIWVKNISVTRNKNNFQKTVSVALAIPSWRVADVKFQGVTGNSECLNYSFLLIDDFKSDLHKTFYDLVNDQPDQLKDFAPACEDSSPKWKISEENTAEIVGVVFGIVALIVLVICFVIWLRKKHQDDEQNSKLVNKGDGDTIANAGFAPEREEITDPAVDTPVNVPSPKEDDAPEHSPKRKEWNVTTSL